ncbi:DEAD/DEAH box helicase [Rubritalea marina]|uniref:DEAD/DEAH box helicase n=1 Tax=Rubritalea marina TaxID=361055 RepID=UPI0003637C6B|nr:DEAD/DEAH box helicase [Rubritalea marina]
MPFTQLHSRLQQALDELKFTKATPIQERAIPKVMKGGDVIGIAQTGTGKTAAFLLPLLHALIERTEAKETRHTRILVIAPTRELVSQIQENCKAFCKYTNLRSAAIHGGISDKGQIDKLNSSVDIVIATPGRLLDLVERGFGKFGQVDALVLDEADRMLDMGFIPDIRTICKKLPKSRQTLLFSATMNKQVESITKEFLHSPTIVEVDRRANPAETIQQSIYEVYEHQKIDLLKHLLASSHTFYSVIVFVRTRHGAEDLIQALKADKISAEAIHGDKKQGQRRRALKDFQAGDVRVLVATDVAARGIDISGVTHVINFDFPEHSEDYIHRIGRTGRAEQEGEAITFTTPQNQLALRKLEKLIRVTLPRKRAEGFHYDKQPVHAEPKRRNKKQEKPNHHQSPSKFSNKNKPNTRSSRDSKPKRKRR